MFRKIRKGQSTLEYTILLIIVMGAFLGVSNYFKRGVQGRWKSAVDDFGDQYDPRTTNSSIRHLISSNSVTTVIAINMINGFWTFRTDASNTLETKTGSSTVGGYYNFL